MKRRKFIKLTAGVLPSIIGAGKALAEGRLYGTPGSVQFTPPLDDYGHVVLPLSKAQLPPTVQNDLVAYANVWARALSDRQYREELFAAPKVAARMLGTHWLTDSHSLEWATLLATWDPILIDALERQDYLTYLTQLKYYLQQNGPSGYVPSARVQEINKLVQQRGQALLEAYHSSGIDLSDSVENEELAYLAMSICTNTGVVVAVPVAIVAIAAIYVSVGAAVTVATLAGVTVSVAVSLAVAASGTSAATEGQPLSLSESLNESSFPALSKQDYYELMATIKIAAKKGEGRLQYEAFKEVVRREIDVAFRAAEQLDLIHIHPKSRDRAINDTTTYVLKTLGFPVNPPRETQ